MWGEILLMYMKEKKLNSKLILGISKIILLKVSRMDWRLVFKI